MTSVESRGSAEGRRCPKELCRAVEEPTCKLGAIGGECECGNPVWKSGVRMCREENFRRGNA